MKSMKPVKTMSTSGTTGQTQTWISMKAMVATVASHQILALRRRRVLGVLVGSLVGVTVLAGILGWASHQTIIGVYDESAKLLAARGLNAPPNPFLLKPALSLLSNMVIYITMIGALVAAVLGHLTVAEDDTTGIGRLVFSRQISRRQYASGKLCASGLVLGASMIACAVVSVVALLISNGVFPSVGDISRLALFYGFSWVYLMVFAMVGIVTLLIAGRRSLGLLSAMGAWLVVTFAVPQFTSGLRPSQSLNPIVDPISTSQAFFKITRRARPFSIAEEFKEISARMIRTAPAESLIDTIIRALPIVAVFAILCVLAVRLVQRHDFSRSNSGE
jgi:ABC-type transport system involved in multi-copper enzyme maturation permease subunit